MRRSWWVVAGLLVSTALGGMAASRMIGGEPAVQPSPPVVQPSPPGVQPAPPAQSLPGPTPPAPPSQQSAADLAALIKAAPAGSLVRIQVQAGQPINRAGLFFMQSNTGAIEGWVFAGDKLGAHPAWASPDNRWIQGDADGAHYIADRKSGAVFRWEAADLQLLTARDDSLLLRWNDRLWIADSSLTRFRPVDLTVKEYVTAEFLGDVLILLTGTTVHRVDAQTGRASKVSDLLTAEMGARQAGNGWLTRLAGGDQVVAAITFTDPGGIAPPLSRVERYSAGGDRRGGGTVQGVHPMLSPDGRYLAWQERLLGLTRAVMVAPLAGSGSSPTPTLRMIGGFACSTPHQGPYWLADGAALVTQTTAGPRLLRPDGGLSEVPGKGGPYGYLPIPAPDRTGLLFRDLLLVDGAGKELIAAVPHTPGSWMVWGHLPPWGDRSDESRFVLHHWGKGVACDPEIFGPRTEMAPFPAVTGLTVTVAANDCVNLRAHYDRSAPVLRCLPTGSRLWIAHPPGFLNKGSLQAEGPLMLSAMGGDWWAHVRTEDGERGWVLLSDEYLSLSGTDGQSPPADAVRQRIEDQIANLRYWLRVALGEATCAGVSCSHGPEISELLHALQGWCESAPGAIRISSAFSPAAHGGRLTVLETACSDLAAESARSGSGQVMKERLRALLGKLGG